jgi:ferritin-like metal-binding protein YciE
MGKRLDNLEDLFIEELKEAYDVEGRITRALPGMSAAASSPALKSAFQEHLMQARKQKERLEDIFREIGRAPAGVTSDGMKGIIMEGEMLMKAKGDPVVRDVALISSAQRAEHYQMACYGTLRAFAQHLGWKNVADLLDTTLREERDTDSKLTQVAESGINQAAAER